MKKNLSTKEGFHYALVMLREQRGMTSDTDQNMKEVLEDAIKFFEEKLHAQ